MEAPIRAVRRRIEQMIEDLVVEPSYPEQRPDADWPPKSDVRVFAAADDILNACWMLALSRVMPDHIRDFIWKGKSYHGTLDEPIGLQLLEQGERLLQESCRAASITGTLQTVEALRMSAMSASGNMTEYLHHALIVDFVDLLVRQRHVTTDCFGVALPRSIIELHLV